MKTRSPLPWAGLCVAAAVVVFSLWYSQAKAQPQVKPQTLAKQATDSFKLQSYNEAIEKANQYLEASPNGPESIAMRRLVGLSQVGLQQWPQGYETLTQLLKQRDELQKDAVVLEAIAIAAIQNHRIQEVQQWVDKAVAQFAAKQDNRKQIDLLFRLAEFLAGHTLHEYQPGQPIPDYNVRGLFTVTTVLKVYDRILALNALTTEDTVRALDGQASIVLAWTHQIVNLPMDQWPPQIDRKWNLAKPLDVAIEFEREIVLRFPGSDVAATALLKIGDIQSNNKQNFLAALETYRSVVDQFPQTQHAKTANEQIAEIKRPQLGINVQETVLPGENPPYLWNARNLKVIRFKAYAVDLFDVLKKIEHFHLLDSYALTGEPVAEWTVETGDKADHHYTSIEDPIKAPLDQANAYLVEASGASPEDKVVQVRTLMLVSRLAAILKTTQGEDLLFAADAVSGEPMNKTEVLVQRQIGTRVVAGETKVDFGYSNHEVADNGLLNIEQNTPAVEGHEHLSVVARNGKNYALVANEGYFGYWHRQMEGTRVYAMTDRPVYRPLQTVHFKQIIRTYRDGTYQTIAGQKVNVLINDSRGNKVHEELLTANESGSISGSFTLGEEPTLGMYHMNVTIGNNGVETGPGASFRVEEYKKPEYEVTAEPEKSTYKVGQKIRVKVHGEYYFGGPVPDAKVTYTIHRNSYYHDPGWPIPYGWFYDEDGFIPHHRGKMMGDFDAGFGGHGFWPWRPTRKDLVGRGELVTDENGDAFVEFESKPFEETPETDLNYTIEIDMVDQSRREIKAHAAVKVTHQAFYIGLKPQKSLYHPNDKARVEVSGENPNGKSVAFEGSATLAYVTQREERDEHGKIIKEEKLEPVKNDTVTTPDTGKQILEYVPEKEGMYKVTVTAPDPYGGEITGNTYVWVGKGAGEFAHYAYRDLELVADRTTLEAGDNLHLLVTSKYENSYVLLTAEADGLYYHKVLFVPKNGTTLEIPIEKSWQPNVTLHASLLHDHSVFSEEIAVKVPPVEDFLTVTLKAPKQVFLPREEAEVEVVVTDHKGNPVACEISLGVVDSSIFYIQPETRGDIRKFFHGRVRPQLVQTQTSYQLEFQGGGYVAEATLGMGGFAGYSDNAINAPRARMMSMGMMAEEPMEMAKSQAAPDQLIEPEVRSEFPDTVFWAAHLTTSADGKATTKIRFPDSLTTWRLTSVAADPRTRVGEIKHEVITRKNIIVRLQGPRFFVERDRVVLSAIAHNYSDQEQQIRVKMQTGPQLSLLSVSKDGSLMGDDSGSEERHLDVTVPPGGEQRVDFLAAVHSAGKVAITASALTSSESDAMKQEFEVLEYGAEKLLAESGVLFGMGGSVDDVDVSLLIPAQIREGSQSLAVRVSPTVAGVMLQSLPYLLDYPYGCTEQTMSRFLPAVLTSHTLKKLGIDLADLKNLPQSDAQLDKRLQRWHDSPVYDAKEMQKIIAAGIERLADFQQADGGWGWWKQDQSNPYITAYVVSGLALARRAEVTLPDQMLERAVGFLAAKVTQAQPVTHYPWQREENTSVRAYMLFAIAEADAQKLADPKVREQIDLTFQRRDQLSDYSRALLALTLHKAKMSEQAGIVLANIKDRARVEKDTSSASWGDYSGYYYWYQCGTEATSFSLRALLAIAPDDPMIPQVVNWLLRHRRGTRWFNTKDTANVCYALSEYLEQTDELNPDMTVTVEVDGKHTKSIRFTRDNILTGDAELNIAAEVLGTGAKKVTIHRQGKGNLYWGAYATFFTKEDHITAAGNEIFVNRKYFRLEPKEVQKTRTIYDPKTRESKEETFTALQYIEHPLAEGESLSSGELVEVKLEITSKNNFEYLLFEDPKPAGCEAVDLKSGNRWGNGIGAHMELRDERVAFFATYLNQGTHSINYRLRAEIPGVFHALPSRAECMYSPFVRGNADSRVITVIEAKK